MLMRDISAKNTESIDIFINVILKSISEHSGLPAYQLPEYQNNFFKSTLSFKVIKSLEFFFGKVVSRT